MEKLAEDKIEEVTEEKPKKKKKVDNGNGDYVSKDDLKAMQTMLAEMQNKLAATNEALEKEKKKNKEVKTKQVRDLNEMVLVRSAANTKIVYVSKKTMGYRVDWNKMGDTHYVALGELFSMKSNSPRYFRDGWLIIEDPEVIEYLGLVDEFKNIIDINNFDGIFDLSPKKLKEKLTNIPKGMREQIGKRATELIKEEKLDSINKINVIKDVLNFDLDVVMESVKFNNNNNQQKVKMA